MNARFSGRFSYRVYLPRGERGMICATADAIAPLPPDEPENFRSGK
jgi:hypothetical protein